MSATLTDAFIAADSNPGHVEVGYGGVARNIAHNLTLLGARTQLLTIFGGDLFGGLLHDYCKQQGIDVHLSERESSLRSGLYLCLHNHAGEMIAAVADTEAIRLITPEWLAKRSGELNLSDYVVADTNIGEEAIRWLMENVTVPLFIDGVSTTKAHRVVNALRKAKLPYLHTLKLNLKEALAVTEKQTYGEAAQELLDLGAAHVPDSSGRMALPCVAGRNSEYDGSRRRVPCRSRVRACERYRFSANGAVWSHGGAGYPHDPQSGQSGDCKYLVINEYISFYFAGSARGTEGRQARCGFGINDHQSRHAVPAERGDGA